METVYTHPDTVNSIGGSQCSRFWLAKLKELAQDFELELEIGCQCHKSGCISTKSWLRVKFGILIGNGFHSS